MLDQLVEDVLTQLLVPSLKNKKLFVACTKYTDLRWSWFLKWQISNVFSVAFCSCTTCRAFLIDYLCPSLQRALTHCLSFGTSGSWTRLQHVHFPSQGVTDKVLTWRWIFFHESKNNHFVDLTQDVNLHLERNSSNWHKLGMTFTFQPWMSWQFAWFQWWPPAVTFLYEQDLPWSQYTEMSTVGKAVSPSPSLHQGATIHIFWKNSKLRWVRHGTEPALCHRTTTPSHKLRTVLSVRDGVFQYPESQVVIPSELCSDQGQQQNAPEPVQQLSVNNPGGSRDSLERENFLFCLYNWRMLSMWFR